MGSNRGIARCTWADVDCWRRWHLTSRLPLVLLLKHPQAVLSLSGSPLEIDDDGLSLLSSRSASAGVFSGLFAVVMPVAPPPSTNRDRPVIQSSVLGLELGQGEYVPRIKFSSGKVIQNKLDLALDDDVLGSLLFIDWFRLLDELGNPAPGLFLGVVSLDELMNPVP